MYEMTNEQWQEFYNEQLEKAVDICQNLGMDAQQFDDDGQDPLRLMLLAIEVKTKG